MARRGTQNRSEDDSDPISLITIEAPKRIYELKKERDERAKSIVAETEKALAPVRQQAEAYREKRRRDYAIKRSISLKTIIELVEKRKHVEGKMLEVVLEVHLAMQELEEMMLEGYEGRRKDARQSLEILRGNLQHG